MVTKTIALTAVIVPEGRQRSEVPDEHVTTLMDSIFSRTGPGLMNPITLREGNTLSAGECRLRAVKLGYTLGKTLRHAGQVVPPGHIPYIDFGELDELGRMEAEYVENAVRQDLGWQDKARALAGLDALRKKQAAAAGVVHTSRDTAQEVYKRADGDYRQKVEDSVALVKHLDKPEIAKATSMKEASKILRKMAETEVNAKRAAEVGKVLVGDRFRVFNDDCLVWMAAQPSEQYDVILTDPPYGMGADSFGDAAGRLAGTEHHYDDGRAETLSLLYKAIPEFYRLAKPEAHLYLWCDIDLFRELRDYCTQAGWWTHRTPLVNVKPEGGRVPWPENGPRRSYELCLYAVKGKKPVTAIKPDVFESRLTEGQLGHGAQKPVAAYVELLSRSVRPGDVVLDAFAGTGTIFPAAHQLKCKADGVEMNPASYGICLKRIGDLK